MVFNLDLPEINPIVGVVPTQYIWKVLSFGGDPNFAVVNLKTLHKTVNSSMVSWTTLHMIFGGKGRDPICRSCMIRDLREVRLQEEYLIALHTRWNGQLWWESDVPHGQVDCFTHNISSLVVQQMMGF